VFDWLKRRSAIVAPPVAPRSTESLIAAADAARERGDRGEALALYTSAHASAPDRVYPLYWLATLLQEAGELDSAAAYGIRGLNLEPSQIALLMRMASIADARSDPLEALRYYERVAAIDPEVPDLDASLADQLCYLGRLKEGVAAFDRAIVRAPDSQRLQQSRLFCLNYSDLLSPSAMADEHRAWGRLHEREFAGSPCERPAIADRGRLRIGYVSPDLRNHAVAYFVAPLLRHHDRARYEIVVFDTSREAEDWMTAEMRSSVDTWHRVGAIDDDAFAAAIRAVGIDVLVDLSGHTKGNRLLAFARRPATIQVTWLGYLGTTGLTAMDYRLTDAHMDPVGMTEALHTEALVRLPVQACFSPWPDAPRVSPSPLADGHPLTFGSVNQWAKVSDGCKDLWASILAACPGARLFVIARGGHNPALQRWIASEFERRGAQPGQVKVFPFGTTTDFLRFLGRIDIALDPFPYGGGTTTFQCLWMGVPVITLAGVTPMSRNAIGPLVHAGLQDLVAATPEAYREAAVALGHDAVRLVRLRGALRSGLADSPAMDAGGFARAVETQYSAMWNRAMGAEMSN
jgi:protein O-GlcNAc transferase